jgi:hypothetical protein
VLNLLNISRQKWDGKLQLSWFGVLKINVVVGSPIWTWSSPYRISVKKTLNVSNKIVVFLSVWFLFLVSLSAPFFFISVHTSVNLSSSLSLFLCYFLSLLVFSILYQVLFFLSVWFFFHNLFFLRCFFYLSLLPLSPTDYEKRNFRLFSMRQVGRPFWQTSQTLVWSHIRL